MLSRDIAQQLAALAADTDFATTLTSTADPKLHVEGIGRIALPVTLHTAHQLCSIARPAQHGYKDQTRLDPRVRDTWEIPASNIHFESPRWPAVVERALGQVRHDLGLSATTQLRAELHNLLIYAPGQFFTVHQDSEKNAGMFGTLVITLPSHFSGGELIISHQGRTRRIGGSAKSLGLVAFYADCQHEVRPVTEGYRVVLTYNLLMQPAQQLQAALPESSVAALAEAVRTFWQTPTPPRWSGDDEQPPQRLVYLLDHQYTPSGLSWSHLKSADASRVAALQAVAKQLDAEIFLALADVHEVWSAEDDYQYSRYSNPEGDFMADPALGEMIDSAIELRHWLAQDGGEQVFGAGYVDENELCLTRPTSEYQPFESSYEGYMGNYGNTLDRWYHRAAVVMWPREHAFSIRARQSPDWAMQRIVEQIENNDLQQARIWVRSLLPFWNSRVAQDGGSALLEATLYVAEKLDEDEIAAALLAPFSLQHLTPSLSLLFLGLLDRYGLDWCCTCLQDWSPAPYYALDPDQPWLWLTQALPEIIEEWIRSGQVQGSALAMFLLEDRWGGLQQHIQQIRNRSGGSRRIQALEATSPALLALIRSSTTAGGIALQQRILALLCADELLLPTSLAVLQCAVTDALGTSDLGPLHAHCLQALTLRLSRPERTAEDWSILLPEECTAEPAITLKRFLNDPNARHLDWPLAKPQRQIIHRLIEQHELPVRHETQRTGRPYTLVLEKQAVLFEQIASERQLWLQQLNWLREVAEQFS